MPNDLTDAREAILAARLCATDALAENLTLAEQPVNRHTYIRRFDAQALAAAKSADSLLAVGAPLSRLAGLGISVKDLFDVEGMPTTAASRILMGAAPAQADCLAVARLRSAGAALTGHTNMTEFAFSGVGINPHHGTPPNAATLAADPEPRIPGGSTSGGAVSVASGAAWAALGSDTGGSIRIPAALQGLVGFKNTARFTPTSGALPLSTTLDTTCAITRSVRDAVTLHEVLADRQVTLARRPLASLRLGVPTRMLDGMDAAVTTAWQRVLARLRRAGAHVDEIALPEIDELAAINATGGFSAAESWAWHRRLITQRQAEYDPRVAQRIRRGETMSAADYIDLLRARADWIRRTAAAMQAFDALISPTVPIVAPTIASLASDEAFFAANALLLRNPSVVNMLDGCALSQPCHSPGELPVGLMVWSHAMQDDTVLDVSLTIERMLAEGAS
jgi:amidase/aspartyl-tRNA(Asn)/glutamyl-tRNA(Gln) amidotransferase subunit A